MKKFKKTLILILCLVLIAISFGGCKKNQNNNDMLEKTKFVEPYKTQVSSSGKSYIANRKNDSMLMLSTQITADLYLKADFMKAEDLSPYFAIAKETGFNVVDIPILWNQVESQKDNYDYSIIKAYLDLAKKFDLKMNLLWYGSLKDGETKGYSLPEYIFSNPTDYTVLKDVYDGGVYGRVRIMKWNDLDLLNRESKVLYNLMNYVYDWNVENDEYDPIITLQLGQGTADRFYRWRIGQYEIIGKDGLMTQSEAEIMIADYIRQLSAAVKKSAYRPLIRLEFCEQGAVTEETLRVKNIENVDLISPTYLHSVPENKNGTNNFATDERLNNMPVINAENWASDINYRQILTAIVSGGVGYNSYILSPANFYPMSPNGAIYERMDSEKAELKDKFKQINTRADDCKIVNNLLKLAPYCVTTVASNGILALGMNNKLSAGDTQKSYITYKDGNKTKGIFIDYEIPENLKALGFAAVSKEESGICLYVTCSSNAKILFNRGNIIMAQKGTQNKNGEWQNEANVSLGYNNKGLDLLAGELYRLKINNVEDMLAGKPLADSGYESAFASLRG